MLLEGGAGVRDADAVGRGAHAGDVAEGVFFGGEGAAHARLQRGGHEVVRIRRVIQPQRVAVFVQKDGEHVHLAFGFATRFSHPFVGVAGGEEFLVQVGRVVDEPAVAGGGGVEGDFGA